MASRIKSKTEIYLRK